LEYESDRLRLVIGLGNPGRQYEGSRHNLGFEVMEALRAKFKLSFELTQPDSETAVWRGPDNDIVFARPLTFMNRSGQAAAVLLHRYLIESSQILVLVDDFNLPLGRIRIRKGGSDGGHNGLESIIYALGTDSFPRLRMGIGPVPEDVDVIGFVLNKFQKDETALVDKMIKDAAEAVSLTMRNRLDEAMNRYNINPA